MIGSRTLWSHMLRAGSRYIEVWRNNPEGEADARRYHFRRINWHAVAGGRYVTFVLASGLRVTVKYR